VRAPGASLGIALIVIGIVVLLGEIVPGLAWWTLWPLIIVVAGLIQAFTPGRQGWNVERLFDGFVTVAIGLVILGITTGYVGFGVVWQILALWPVLLIALGLDLLGKATRATWVSALGSIAVIGALGYAVALNVSGAASFSLLGGTTEGNTTKISEPVGLVREADLVVKAGVAEVKLADGTRLVDATGVSPWGEPDFSVSRSGHQADVKLSLGEADSVVTWPGGPRAAIDAELGRGVLWDLLVEIGVTTLDADLSDLSVRSIEVKPGVSDCTITLGEVPGGIDVARTVVKSGVSSVKLRVPDDVEARVESDSGLTGHSLDESFESTGSRTWETSEYDAARSAGRGVWLITVQSGIGSVDVETY
jgi:hypothetical protein